MKPPGCAPCSSVTSSWRAQSRSTWVRAMAWKQESQNHWKGYELGEGTT